MGIHSIESVYMHQVSLVCLQQLSCCGNHVSVIGLYYRLYTRHGRKLKSQVKHTTTSPEWNEDFKFLVHVPQQQFLNGVLKDWVRLSASDVIGR